jgi:tetratricopeptide (TPR) repeat protein
MRIVSFLLVFTFMLVCGSAHCQQGEQDSVRQKLALANNDNERLAVYLEASQRIYNSDPLLALEYGQQAKHLAKKLDNDSLKAYSDYAQANALLHLGNYAQALDLYLSLLKYGEKDKDSVTLVIAYGNIGNVYYFQHDFDSALSNYSRSILHFSKTVNDRRQMLRKALLLSNTGSIFDELKRYSEAKKCYEQALSIGRSINDHEVIGNVLNNTGTLYRDEGNDTLAIKFYREAYAVRVRHGNLLGMARSCYAIGLYHYHHQKLDSAAIYLERSIQLGKKVGSLQTVSSAAEIYYKVSKELGNEKIAREALELFMEMKDSLFNEQTTKRIAQLEMQFQFDKKQSQLENAQKEKDLYYLLGASLLLLLFLLATVLFLLQKSKTRKAQLKETQLQLEKVQLKNDLDKKDKELATNITFLLSKNELINSVSEKLLEIKQSAPAESQSPLQKLILDIQSNLQPELWQEFEVRFQQVYESFYKILTVRFPDLSPSERRLCAFLKLNMTTKEISALIHQNAKSIDVARTRLRKKLGLTGSDQNLVTFLEQLDSE